MDEDYNHDYFDHKYSQGLCNSQDLGRVNISDDETVLPSHCERSKLVHSTVSVMLASGIWPDLARAQHSSS